MYIVKIVKHGKVEHILGVVDFRFIDIYCYIYIKKGGIYDRIEVDLTDIDDIVISFDLKNSGFCL